MISDWPCPRVNGEALREYRRGRVISIVDLADEADVSPSTITRLERGATARPRTIRKIAEALGVQPWMLLPREGE